ILPKQNLCPYSHAPCPTFTTHQNRHNQNSENAAFHQNDTGVHFASGIQSSFCVSGAIGILCRRMGRNVMIFFLLLSQR
ncbi:hypothetical protein QIH19_27650, partial [Klebsiella pneumoniae]|nr:hypothetical protein [Klebsiella pneumoniae]